jgi:hAT family C-terminal dimerisation region
VAPPVTCGIIDAAALRAERGAYKKHHIKGGDDETLSWWKTHEALFPNVALAAKYFLAIPATSVASERLFSKEGWAITKMRARLTGGNAECYTVLYDALKRARRQGNADHA